MRVALGLALAGGPARAVVGGAEEAGPLARQTVMVLSSRGGVCTGIVLAPDAVLTAAHCAGRGAELRLHWREAGGGEPVLRAVAAVVLHPGYDAGAVAGRRRSIDLALVRPAEPLPARFAPAALTGAGVAAGQRLTLAGYGVARMGDARSTGTLRGVCLPVVEPYGPSRILVWLRPDGPPAGACGGDSGGPITTAPDGATEPGGGTAAGAVLAVTSWATGPRGECGGVTQGVLVGPQRAWIDATLARWGAGARWE